MGLRKYAYCILTIVTLFWGESSSFSGGKNCDFNMRSSQPINISTLPIDTIDRLKLEFLDLCQNWTLEGVVAPTIDEPFQNKPEALAKFENNYSDKNTRSTAIQTWALTTETYNGQDKSAVETVELVVSEGVRNRGIFLMKVNGVPKHIAKITTCAESERLLKLNSLGLFHEDCIQAKIPTIDCKVNCPAFAKILEVTRVPHSSTQCIQILELAPGKSMKEQASSPGAGEMFEQVGRRLAIFHSLGWNHEDLNPGNVFFDPATRKVTFIDNETMTQGTNHNKDLLSVSNPLLNRHTNSLQYAIQENVTKTAGKADYYDVDPLEFRKHYLKYSSQKGWPASDKNLSSLCNNLNESVITYNRFVRGYIKGLPDSMRAAFIDRSKSICKNLLNFDGFQPDDLDALYSHMPAVTECIHGHF